MVIARSYYDETLPKSLERTSVNGRKGHRTYVSKTMNSAEDISKEYDQSQEEKLLSCKGILVGKLDTLQNLDDKITELTDDEKALEEEIDRSSELRRFMKEIIRKIESNMDMNHPQQQQPQAQYERLKQWKRPSCQNYKLKHLVEKLLNGHPFMIHSSHLWTQTQIYKRLTNLTT